MFDEEKETKTNLTIYHILEDGVIVTTILVSMHGNANSGKAYWKGFLKVCLVVKRRFIPFVIRLKIKFISPVCSMNLVTNLYELYGIILNKEYNLRYGKP